MGKENNKYYLVEASALPEVFIKVTKAKELLETGAVKTVAEAVERVDLSRSAFYKYKDAVKPFKDMKRGNVITFSALLNDKPGVLGHMLSIFTASGANILTINQSIPTNGAAFVTFSISNENMIIDTENLMDNLQAEDGVINVQILAG